MNSAIIGFRAKLDLLHADFLDSQRMFQKLAMLVDSNEDLPLEQNCAMVRDLYADLKMYPPCSQSTNSLEIPSTANLHQLLMLCVYFIKQTCRRYVGISVTCKLPYSCEVPNCIGPNNHVFAIEVYVIALSKCSHLCQSG